MIFIFWWIFETSPFFDSKSYYFVIFLGCLTRFWSGKKIMFLSERACTTKWSLGCLILSFRAPVWFRFNLPKFSTPPRSLMIGDLNSFVNLTLFGVLKASSLRLIVCCFLISEWFFYANFFILGVWEILKSLLWQSLVLIFGALGASTLTILPWFLIFDSMKSSAWVLVNGSLGSIKAA